jgi:hypothetical protein
VRAEIDSTHVNNRVTQIVWVSHINPYRYLFLRWGNITLTLYDTHDDYEHKRTPAHELDEIARFRACWIKVAGKKCIFIRT